MDHDKLNASYEEGEIVDEESEDEQGANYSPLKRPDNYSEIIGDQRFDRPTVDNDSDNDAHSSSSSESGSDKDTSKRKKPKIKVKPISSLQNPRRKKYDVWSNRAQEDVLLETMSNFDVTKKDRSRDVETYDFTLSYSYQQNRSNNKRTRGDRNNQTIRPVNKVSDEIKTMTKPRLILKLNVNKMSSIEDLAIEMSNRLCEEKIDLISTIIKVIGKEKAINIFERVRKIEKEGGMLIMNQTRRRTPGGVYLFLVKHDNNLTSEQQIQIFGDEKDKYRQEQKLKKKMKREQLKAKIAMERESRKLPELLTKAELCIERINSDKGTLKESDHDNVTNPPPTPETDGQTSGDSMDNLNLVETQVSSSRKVQNYGDDYLDINVDTNMDFF